LSFELWRINAEQTNLVLGIAGIHHIEIVTVTHVERCTYKGSHV
jgi:hypothetical protein